MKMTGLTLLALIGLGATSEAGPITYDIANYSALQNGYTLSGTITTDGNIGALTSGDISSWTFTITNGTTTLTGSSTDPNASIYRFNGLQASSTSLTLGIPGDGESFQLEFDDSSSGQVLAYDRKNDAGRGVTLDSYQETNGSAYPWSQTTSGSNTLSLGAVNPWTIATASAVPEPSSLVLAGIAVVGGTVVAIRRRRK